MKEKALGANQDQALPFKEHLAELRSRLFKILLILAAGFAACWFFAGEILEIISRPIKPILIHTEGKLIFTGPLEKFLSYLKVSLFAGALVSCPFWLFQIWRFVSPGLYEREKKWPLFFAGAGALLFCLGAAFVYFAALPLAFRFLMSFGGEGEAAYISLREYLSFFIRTALAFGAVFELPLILFFLLKAGILKAETLASMRPYAVVAIALLSAFITPPDVFSMIFMMAPLYLLFEASLWIGRRV